ncbi:MAG: GNAT family N-acetyltransferase [Pseudomonadota bacterium]|jgi:RimJ/RimL family protein N-acetyltransferase|nr:GNAT family N-acetyltransferase [Pseudomonadota bacterium]
MFHVTERLLLRPAWPEDAEAIFGGISDEGVVRNLASAPWPYRREDAESFVSRDHVAAYPRFLITQKSRLIGCIGIDQIGEQGDGSVELGYWIARPYWGRGYATEAARGMIDIARLIGHTRLSAGHFADNPASGRVLRKVGFRPTGQSARRHSCGRGEAAECVLFSLDLADQPQMPIAA